MANNNMPIICIVFFIYGRKYNSLELKTQKAGALLYPCLAILSLVRTWHTLYSTSVWSRSDSHSLIIAHKKSTAEMA